MGMTFAIRGISADYLNSTLHKVNYFYHNNGIYSNTTATRNLIATCQGFKKTQL